VAINNTVKLYKEMLTKSINKLIDVNIKGIGWIYNASVTKMFNNFNCVIFSTTTIENGKSLKMKLLVAIDDITAIQWIYTSTETETKSSPKIDFIKTQTTVAEKIAAIPKPAITKIPSMPPPQVPPPHPAMICKKCGQTLEVISVATSDPDSKLVICEGCNAMYNMNSTGLSSADDML